MSKKHRMSQQCLLCWARTSCPKSGEVTPKRFKNSTVANGLLCCFMAQCVLALVLVVVPILVHAAVTGVKSVSMFGCACCVCVCVYIYIYIYIYICVCVCVCWFPVQLLSNTITNQLRFEQRTGYAFQIEHTLIFNKKYINFFLKEEILKLFKKEEILLELRNCVKVEMAVLGSHP